MTENRQELINKLVDLKNRRDRLTDQVNALDDEYDKMLEAYSDYMVMEITHEVLEQRENKNVNEVCLI